MKYLYSLILAFLFVVGMNAQTSCVDLVNLEAEGIGETIVITHYPIYHPYTGPYKVLRSLVTLNGAMVVNRNYYLSTYHYRPKDCNPDVIYIKYEMKYDSNGDGKLLPNDDVICFDAGFTISPCNYIKGLGQKKLDDNTKKQ